MSTREHIGCNTLFINFQKSSELIIIENATPILATPTRTSGPAPDPNPEWLDLLMNILATRAKMCRLILPKQKVISTRYRMTFPENFRFDINKSGYTIHNTNSEGNDKTVDFTILCAKCIIPHKWP